jgi:hypothetical protein
VPTEGQKFSPKCAFVKEIQMAVAVMFRDSC